MNKLTTILTAIFLLVIQQGVQGQTLYSFTNAGATGVSGPSQGQVNAAYTSTALAGQVTVVGQGIQAWTVPSTGTFTISAAGASGGGTPNQTGGRGREITMDVNLTAGDVLHILVGQVGGEAESTNNDGYCGGGGGGTFVVNNTAGTPILVAGGGGGAGQGASYSTFLDGGDATAYNNTSGSDGIGGPSSWSPPGYGGTAGGGGTSNGGSGGSGGAGYSGDGTQDNLGGYPGVSYLNGGLGGANRDWSGGFSLDVPGGFGGGAGCGIHSGYEANGGGGGGYSGGGGGGTRVGAGGGGGNYISGTYISDSLNTGMGFVTITEQNVPVQVSVPTLSEWGLIILSALLAFGAVFFMRRQRR